MKALRVMLRLVIEAVALLFAGVVFAVLFALLTESGAQLALRQFETRTGLIHSEGVSGTLWGPLSVEQLSYEDRYLALNLQQATLDWSLLQLLGGRLGISQLHASKVEVTIKAQPPQPDEAPGPALTSLPIGIVVRELRIGVLDIQGAGAPLHFERVALDASWLGDVVDIETLSADTPWVDAAALKGRVQLQPDAVKLEKITLDGFLAAELNGRYAYHAESDLTLIWSALQWPPPAAQRAALVESPAGQLAWKGRVDNWQYALDAKALFDGKDYALALKGRGSDTGMQAEQASVETGHGRIELQAQLDWRQAFSAGIQAQLQDVEPQHWVPQINGTLNGAVNAQLRMDAGKPNLQAQVALDRSILQGHPATLVADASYVAEQLTFNKLDLRSGSTQLQASGKAWPQIALAATLDSGDLVALQPGVSGNAKARVNLDGIWPQLRARGNLQAGDLRYETYTAKSVAADFDIATEGESRADVLLGPMNVGQVIDSAQLRLRGSTKAHELNASAATPQGGISLSLNGAADLQQKTWTGELNALRLSPRKLPAWSLEESATLMLSEKLIETTPICIASDLARFCAALRPVPGARRIAIRLEQFKLPGLQPWLPGGTNLTGQIDGNGYVDLGDTGLKDLRLDLGTTAIELSRSGVTSLKLLPGYVKVEAQGQELSAVASLPFDADGSVAGGISLDTRLGAGSDLMQRKLSGQWRVDMPDLSWLQMLNHEFQKVQGQLNGQLDLGG
ncbi:MAG: hypothetical protein M3O62_14645, partial [Pseudomonadota bacterium]|nr:hypothetical protein [Pseudomonadota bacterium]